jgi:hypothetical protein
VCCSVESSSRFSLQQWSSSEVEPECSIDASVRPTRWRRTKKKALTVAGLSSLIDDAAAGR